MFPFALFLYVKPVLNFNQIFIIMKKIFLLLLLLVFIFGCTSNQTESNTTTQDILVAGSPESVGMSSERMARIDGMIQEYIDPAPDQGI